MHSALEELRNILAPQAVLASPNDLAPYQQNVSSFTRTIPAVVKPKTAEEVQQVVEWARKNKLALYPFSQGKNWGMGSRLPVSENNVLVDLSGMNRILHIDEEFGVATIEPGVTQEQLAEELSRRQSRFILDVTGSGRGTSILGNTLDRGIAYNSLRAETLVNLELVLGTGELLKTGFGHYPQSKITHLYRFGIGPDMLGLFLQSNFGIATAATIKLLPLPPYQSSFMVNLKDERRLGELIETLRHLKRQGVFDSVVHVGNRYRRLTAAAPTVYDYFLKRGTPLSRAAAEAVVEKTMSSAWSAIGTLKGPKAHVKHAEKVLKARLRPFGQVVVVTRAKLRLAARITELLGMHKLRAFLEMGKAAYGMTFGQPTNAPLKSVYWPLVEHSSEPDNPDASPAGLLFCLPIIPMDRSSIHGAIDLAEGMAKDAGFKIAMTLNLLHDQALEGVFNIDFDRRRPAEVRKAQETIRRMTEAFFQKGFIPYRLDIETMKLARSDNDVFWNKAQDLKKVFDPDHVIAPGRYSLF